jgi:hypothetical protein
MMLKLESLRGAENFYVVIHRDCHVKVHQSYENEGVLQILQEKRNIIQTINRRKAKWIGHTFRRNCLLKHVIQGNIKRMRRRQRNYNQLLDKIKERRYWKLKDKALDRILWRTRFGRSFKLDVRQTTEYWGWWYSLRLFFAILFHVIVVPVICHQAVQ